LEGKNYAWSPHLLLHTTLMNILGYIGSSNLFVVSLRTFFLMLFIKLRLLWGN
jgi:hypothetical protein